METMFSNEEMVEAAVIGADHTATGAPANPPPPTNIGSVGETPPNTPELERIPVMFERSPHGERSFCIPAD